MANTGHAARVDARAGMGSGKQFVLDISNWVKKVNGDTEAILRGAALDLAKDVIQRTPVDTGRAKASWMFSEGNADTATVDVPAIFKRKLKEKEQDDARREAAGAHAEQQALTRLGSVKWDPKTHRSFYITNSLPYIKRLEYGWSVLAPHGMVRLSALNFARRVREQVRIVRAKGPALP